MFQTEIVSRRIRDARIGKNMTQVELADEMGVSYQAVSNWERGNSMPDISKLSDLCGVLDISLQELLGQGPETETVEKVINNKTENLDLEEISAVAELIPPKDLKQTVDEAGAKKAFDLHTLSSLAPFLDRETVDHMAAEQTPADIYELTALAPFLSRTALETLVKRLENRENINMWDLEGIVPFLGRECREFLAEKIVPNSIEEIANVAPFFSQDTLGRFVERLSSKENLSLHVLTDLAPFLGRETLCALVYHAASATPDEIIQIAPFLNKETLRELIARN